MTISDFESGPQNPGSLNDFSDRFTAFPLAIVPEYQRALSDYREAVLPEAVTHPIGRVSPLLSPLDIEHMQHSGTFAPVDQAPTIPAGYVDLTKLILR